jgi:hypothetical protein
VHRYADPTGAAASYVMWYRGDDIDDGPNNLLPRH